MFAGLSEKDALDYWGRQSTRRRFDTKIKDISNSRPVSKSMLSRRIGKNVMFNRKTNLPGQTSFIPKKRMLSRFYPNISKIIIVVQVKTSTRAGNAQEESHQALRNWQKVKMRQEPACLNVIDKSE